MEPRYAAWKFFLLHFDLLQFAIPMATALPFACLLFMPRSGQSLSMAMHNRKTKKYKKIEKGKGGRGNKDRGKQKTTTVIA